MALPKIIYPLTVLPNINDDLLNEITKSMFNFLWDNKPDKIKRKIIMQKIENGGLKKLDIQKFIYSLNKIGISIMLFKKNTCINTSKRWKQRYKI